MSELWKEIFHDSDDYIRLVINDGLDLNLCEYIYDNSGRMTSMIVGIPYRFVGDNHTFTALYLCGVCTIKSNRGKGEFKTLLSALECRAKSMNFDFLFLIPANEKLRHFYKKYSFEDMGDKINLSCHNNTDYLSKEYHNSTDKETRFITLNTKENIVSLDDISDLISNRNVLNLLRLLEARSGRYYLIHSEQQWQYVFEEWLLSGNYINIESEKVIRENLIFESDRIRGDKYSNIKISSISFIRRDSPDYDYKESDIHSPYGMMKRLSAFEARSREFGISFMMD